MLSVWKKILTFLIVFLLGLNFDLSAETCTNEFILRGKTIDAQTNKKAIFVNVFNESKRTGCLSDTNGNFDLKVCPGDTLVFYSMVYLGKVFHVSDSSDHNNLQIHLSPQSYEIEEARVIGFRNYQEFKQEFIDLELPEDQYEVLRANIKSWTIEAVKEGLYNKQMNDRLALGGVGFITNLNPNNVNSRELSDKLEEQSRQLQLINLKFNREMVARLTKLNDDELDDFIIFCRFNDKFLYEASVSEIELKILQKLDLYKKQKDSGYILEMKELDFYVT